MTDAQAEAQAIAKRFPAWPTGWGLELRNRVIEEIATVLAAKDAELAAVKEMYAREGAKALYELERAERAESALAEANKALDDIGALDDNSLHYGPVFARRAREAQGGE